MKIRITDDFLPSEELVIDVDVDEDEEFEDVQLPQKQAYEVIEFWESTSMGGGRSSYEPEDGAMIILAQVESLGDDIEMAAWYQVERDDHYPLSGFPFTTLHSEEVES